MSKNLPDEIQDELFKFDLKFGFILKNARKPAQI
jgi:hypothetical protein